MATDLTIPDVLYFQHRLNSVAQVQAPASVQYDIARTPIDTNGLQQTATLFGQPLSSHQETWGLSSFLTHLSATQPDVVKTPDLHAVQTRLKDAGFLASDYSINGQWDSTSQAALDQWERQQSNSFYAGQHMGATTTQKALASLGWMLPSQVFQGLVGAAKGFAQQTPETVERVGALGGAAAGAAIGAAAGSVIPGAGTAAGALLGAGVGAAVGFFGDLLSHTPDEGQQTGIQQLWDALTPYEEYKGEGGFGRFMEDLGWVTTASALITGVGGGAAAAGQGIAAIGESAAADGTGFWAQALAKGANEDVGWFAKISSHIGRMANADAGTQMLDFYKARGLMAQVARPIISDVIQPAYTGAASAQFASRATSNLGAGPNETTIHKAISDAPLLRTGINIPFLGDIVDLPGFVLNPTQFVPWRLGDLTRGITRLVDTDPAIEGMVNWARGVDPTLSNEAAHAKVTGILGSTPAEVESRLSMLRLEYGVEADSYVQAIQKFDVNDRESFFKGLEGIKDNLRDQVLGEIGNDSLVTAGAREYKAAREEAISGMGKPSLLKSLDAPTAASDSTLRRLMGYSAGDQAGFQSYIERLSNNGRGIEGLGDYFNASAITKGYTEGVRAGDLIPLGTDGKLMSPGVNKTGGRVDIAEAEANVTKLENQISELKKRTDAFVYQPAEVQANMEAIHQGEQQLKQAQATLKSLRRTSSASWDDRTIVAERLDTPTKWDYLGWSRQYGQIVTAMELARDKGLPQYEALKNLHLQFLEQHQDYIPSRLLEKAQPASGGEALGDIPAFFQKAARNAPEEVMFSDPAQSGIKLHGAPQEPSLQDQLHALGYKAVVRHAKNTFDYAVDPRILEVTGVNDYTARHTFYESIGLGVNASQDSSIAKLRSTAMESQVQQLSDQEGWGLSGKNILARLHRGLDQLNNTGVISNETVRGLAKEGEHATVRGGFIVPPKGGLRHFAVDTRDLRPSDVFEALRDIPQFTHQDAAKVFAAIQQGGAFGAELHFIKAPLQTANEVGRVLRISGWQGFTDLARQWHFQAPGAEMKGISSQAVKRAVASAAVGAGAGALFGDDKMHDALAGAGIGLAAGLGVQRLAHRSYGFLPDYLYKVTTALRYSLSPSFDVRRFVKQNLLAAETHDLPPVMNAPRYVKGRTWASLEHGRDISGDAAWTEAQRYWGHLNGVGYNESLDAFDRSLYAAGILGYNPQNRMVAHAYMLKQRGMSDGAVSKAIKDIYTYGTGRTAMEKSINYVFFPFSFEKKLLTTTGDFLLQAPARSALLYEGSRRWYDSTWATDVQDFLDKHVPLLSQLQEFNAFSHGISPGRFLFQGVGEHRTTEGKAAQILASFFIPGGAASTPIHEAVGGIGDLAVAAFHPIAVTGESLTRMGVDVSASNQSAQNFFDEIGGKYIPLIKDLNELYSNAMDQVEAIRHGESPWSQFHDYETQLGDARRSIEPLAASMGYSSPEGFMSSDMGAPFKSQFDNTRYELQQKYPDAANMVDQFQNKGDVISRAKEDILHSRDTSAAYSTIRQVIATEQTWKYLSDNADSTALQGLYSQMATQQIRTLALQHASDPRFAELWQQLYEPVYGPITVEAA